MVAAEAEKRKLKALIKDNGKLKVLRVLARLLLSGAGRVYNVGSSPVRSRTKNGKGQQA